MFPDDALGAYGGLYGLTVDANGLVYAGNTSSVYQYNPDAGTWKEFKIFDAFPSLSSPFMLASPSPDLLIAGSWNGTYALDLVSGTWKEFSKGMVDHDGAHIVYGSGNDYYYISQWSALFKTENGGTSWERIGPPGSGAHLSPEGELFVYNISRMDTWDHYPELIRTSDDGRHWDTYPEIQNDSYILFAMDEEDNMVLGSQSCGKGPYWVLKSTLSVQQPTQGIGTCITDIEPVGDGVFLAGSHSGIFRSADAGKTWNKTLALGGESARTPIDIGSDETVYGILNGKPFVSTDKAATWRAVPSDHVITRPTDLEIGVNGKLYVSNNWEGEPDLYQIDPVNGNVKGFDMGSPGVVINDLVINADGQIVVATNQGAFVSTFNIRGPQAPVLKGPKDFSTGQSGRPTFTWAASETATSYRLQVSTNSNFDESHIVVDTSGITGTAIDVFVLPYSSRYYWRVQAGNLFADGPWTVPFSFRTSSGVATDEPDELPAEVSLSPAFPNPFNPVTTFQLTLPSPTAVRIDVYDVAGNLLKTLFDGVRAAGVSDVKFNATDLPSGTYFVRLMAGSSLITRSVTLVK